MDDLVLKMDLVKEYDMVNWTLLRHILLHVGLTLDTINWIMGCVMSANFAVLINETPSTTFIVIRGLRQGCLLLPLMFILVVEGLSLLIAYARRKGKITGIVLYEALALTHLLFMDDVV